MNRRPLLSLMRRSVPFLLLFALAFAVFSPSLAYRFVGFDDVDYLLANPLVMDDSPWAAIPACFASFREGMYTPLLWCSYALDAVLFRASPASPWAFHFVNVLLHAANAALFALLLARFCKNRVFVFFCAAIWAVHPLRVESVAWIAERKDVLSAFFALLSALAWIRFAQTPRRGSRLAAYLPSLSLFAAALLAKVSVSPLPAVLLLLDVWPLRRIPSSAPRPALRAAVIRVAEKMPFFALSMAAVGLAAAAHADMDAIHHVPLAARLASVPVHAAFYLLKTILPLRLFPLHPDLSTTPVFLLLSLAAIAAIALVALRLRHRAPALLLGILVYALFLAPASGIVRFGMQSVADRFTYLPALGLSVALLALLQSVIDPSGQDSGGPPPPLSPTPRFVVLHSSFCLVVAGLAAMSFRLLPAWRDADALNDRILRFSPANPRILAAKAVALLDDGSLDDALRLSAIACNQPVFFLDAPLVHALVLQELGRPADAADLLLRVPRSAPYPRQLCKLDWEIARAQFAAGRFPDALSSAERALDALPPEAVLSSRPFLHLLAMAAALRAGRPDAALDHARAFPAYASKTSISEADLLPFHLYEWTARHRAASVSFFRALLAPGADPATANNLLWGLATAERSPLSASEVLDAAIQLADSSSASPGILDTLAAAQARAGRFPEAAATLSQALALVESSPPSPSRDLFAGKLRQRLALYRQNEPYSEEAFSRWLAQAWGQGLQTTTKASPL